MAAMMQKEAVAPSVEIQIKDADAPNLFFFIQSVALAALFPIVLVWSGGNTLTAMSRLLLLLCSYFYSAVCVLSVTTRHSKARLLVSLTYAALLALVVDAVLSHTAGMAIIYLDAVWIARVFGRALAEHRASQNPAPVQEAREKLACELVSIMLLALAYSSCAIPVYSLLAGCSLEFVLIMAVAISCFLVPVATVVVLRKHRAAAAAAPSSKEAREKLASELGVIVFLALVLSAYGLCPLCIKDTSDGALFQTSPLEFVMLFLPMLLGCYVPVVIICRLKPLRRQGGGYAIVVVLGVECDTVKVLVWSYFSSFLLFTFFFLLASKAKAVVAVLSICVLGLSVLLGYCLGLYASDSMDRRSVVRSKPKMVAPPDIEVEEKQAIAGLPEVQAGGP